jgi:hypothetical protein
MDSWLGSAEIVTRYVPRTTASVGTQTTMSFGHAHNIMFMFRKIRSTIEDMPNYDIHKQDTWGVGERFADYWDLPESLEYLESCWFDPFYKALERMR